MIAKVLNYLKNRPFLMVLILALTVITVTVIKPGFHLMGWDNYSSYFNLNTNIFRTLWATWRESRGLGVPSDAEVTDIFRLVVCWIIHFFVPEGWLDQVYYCLALWLGVIGMYTLMREICGKYVGRDNIRKLDLFAGISGFLYLFNLNTLSVFYSPIIPFTNRYYALPLTLWALLRFEDYKSKKRLIMLLLIVIASSGSFITPTVVITTLIAFGIFGSFQLGLRKTLGYGIMFLVLNAFWILPFVNYTLEKSAVIPLARTFVEINESTLNRPASIFSLEKQAVMYPSFLDMSFPSINKMTEPIHPLLNVYQSNWGRIMLMIFPMLYIFGSILILVGWKKYKKLTWVPIVIILFLFLSCKEFGVAGGVYSWFKEKIPYFGILFRISDTKFHAYINLAGSVAGSLALGNLILSFSKKKLFYPVLGVVIAVLGFYAWNFRAYFDGNMIGYYVYTKLPKTYQEIAGVINKDEGNGRVLHLPMSSQHHYWRSFNWGYLGSAFFNFMIDHPYIDKTFEPGSMENAYLHSKIIQLLDSHYETSTENQKRLEAEKFTKLLERAGIKYVLVDHSITAEVNPRDIYYNTKQYEVRAEAMMKRLKDGGAAKLYKSYTVPLAELYSEYANLYPVTESKLPPNLPKNTYIDVYEIKKVAPMFAFMNSTKVLSADLENLGETGLVDKDDNLSQKDGEMGVIMPFEQQKNVVTKSNDGIRIDLGKVKAGDYMLTTGADKGEGSYLIDVYGKIENNILDLSFYNRYYPDINGQLFRQFAGRTSFGVNSGKLNYTKSIWLGSQDNSNKEIIDNYRLNLGDNFMALPKTIVSSEEVYVGSYITHGSKLNVNLLEKTEAVSWNNKNLVKSNPLPCYGPMLPGYEGSASIGKDKVELVSTKGSACVVGSNKIQSDYEELEFGALGGISRGENNQRMVAKALEETGEALMRGYVCAQQGEGEGCINMYRHFRVKDQSGNFRMPLPLLLARGINLNVKLGSIPEGESVQTLNLSGIKAHNYKVKAKKVLEFEPSYQGEVLKLANNLTIEFPKPVSEYSYYFESKYQALAMPQEPCRRGDSRVVRVVNGSLVNDMESCSVYMAAPFYYAAKYPYILSFEYWLGSGQQPVIVIGREGDDYLVERASIYQGYPGVNKKTLQDPDSRDAVEMVKNKLLGMELIQASRMMAPDYRLNTSVIEANIHIFQDTDNEGIVGLKSLDVMEYPSAWQEMELTPVGAKRSYEVPKNLAFGQILPSLWLVSFEAGGEKAMLRFNQGYDKQWGVFDSYLGAIFNKDKAVNFRCDGLTNCFELETKQGKNTYLVLYWPEVLAQMGAVVTLTGLILAVALWKRSKKQAAA